MCIAITTNGCNPFRHVVTQTRNEDVLLRSEPVSKPTQESVYSARLSADAGRPISVSAFRQQMCERRERQVLDRTLITTKGPEGSKVPPLWGVVGGVGLVAGAIMGIKGFQTESREDRNLYLGGAISFSLLGVLLGSPYVHQELTSSERREHLGEVEVDLMRGRAPCGEPVPASQVEVKLVSTNGRGEILARTDAQGQAVIPDAEVPKLDAPVNLYVEGRDVGRSDAAVERGRAAALLVSEKDCARGNAPGCYVLGTLYLEGHGVVQNPSRAAAFLEKACTGGSAQGCGLLSTLHLEGRGVALNPSRAVALLEKACTGGDAGACSNLGSLYGKGRVVSRDSSRAAELYGKACRSGDAQGCSNLGAAYLNGTGVPQDPSRAAELFDEACGKGNASACGNLGVCYDNGMGVVQDSSRAVKLFEMACFNGNARACDNLSQSYMMGRGVTQNSEHAAEMRRRAISLGLLSE
ncbi:sel1 repeat family protein [Archangium violaceum]|uniref:tetratricopeptide repeat protein n=1 Tax=Archangium violaceum TaxID=83451 RepID=UPI0019508EE8|nr:tetratricopeptide repeat protein [Archangium violaceum]QRN93222.1 sel1 repeat family protein [Archangium violaceum]